MSFYNGGKFCLFAQLTFDFVWSLFGVWDRVSLCTTIIPPQILEGWDYMCPPTESLTYCINWEKENTFYNPEKSKIFKSNVNMYDKH